jgi:hypothetical protein
MITCHKKHLFARCAERGYKVPDVMPCVVSKQGDEWTIDETHPAYPVVRTPAPKPEVYGPPKPLPPRGAGTAMKGMLKRLGITSSPTCRCNARARDMDSNGLQWCRANLDTISGWLNEEATKRKLPYVELAGKTLIRLAIRQAEKWPEALP